MKLIRLLPVFLFVSLFPSSLFAEDSPFQIFWGPSVETIIRSDLDKRNTNENHDVFVGGFIGITNNRYEARFSFAQLKGTNQTASLAGASPWSDTIDPDGNLVTVSVSRLFWNRKLGVGLGYDILSPKTIHVGQLSTVSLILESHLPVHKNLNLLLGVTDRNLNSNWIDWSGVYAKAGLEIHF